MVLVRRLHNWIIGILCFLFITILFPLEGKTKSIKITDPFDIYPNDIKFNVLRNNEIIGRHLVTFSRLGIDEYRVLVRLNLQVNFLSFPIYKFDYKSDAVWFKGELKSLNAHQNDDGESLNIKIFKDSNGLVVQNANTEARTDLDALPTNHWNVGVLEQNEVINTLTGEISSVEIINLGKSKIVAQGKSIYARKYKYTGDISALVWYSDGGNWVKLEFEGKDGSVIKYECVECGLRKSSR